MSENQTYESYGWNANWVCPVCNHQHSKPHFAFEDQINYKKEPGESGRIKRDFRREGKEYDSLSCKEYVDKYGTGPSLDDKGLQKPLFCSHCGFEDTLIYINKRI